MSPSQKTGSRGNSFRPCWLARTAPCLDFGSGRQRIAMASRSPLPIHGCAGHFTLAFPGNQSDQSSCANQAQKGFTTMKTAEATTTENAAAVAEHAAAVAEQS